MLYMSKLEQTLETPCRHFVRYKNLIIHALAREQNTGYVEKHHILPKSFKMGGEKDTNNIVVLTSREHFIAHLLLAKMSLSKDLNIKMRYALASFMRKGSANKRILTARQFEQARLIFIKVAKETRSGPRKQHTPETILKLKAAKKNHKPIIHFDGRGTIYVNNNIEQKRIQPNMLNFYQSNGYSVGKLKTQCSCGVVSDLQNLKKHHTSCFSQ